MYNRSTSTLLSAGIHAGAVALLFCVTFHSAGIPVRTHDLDHATKLIAPYVWKVESAEKAGGGGGGGDHSTMRASRGALPKAAPRQFVPPQAVPSNPEPKLVMEPTIVAMPNAPLPTLAMAQFGDPLAPPGPASNGRGRNGGIGEGDGGGVGPGRGKGYGPGDDFNAGGGLPALGAGGPRGAITPAALLWKIEPEYSDEARRARLQGTVVLYLEVDSDGRPRNVKVHQSLGLGLDEKAIDAVRHWKFRPGKANGRAVATSALVEVNFRLL